MSTTDTSTRPADMSSAQLDAALKRLALERVGAGATRRRVISTVIDRLLDEKVRRNIAE
jgi:hypothetical protein